MTCAWQMGEIISWLLFHLDYQSFDKSEVQTNIPCGKWVFGLFTVLYCFVCIWQWLCPFPPPPPPQQNVFPFFFSFFVATQTWPTIPLCHHANVKNNWGELRRKKISQNFFGMPEKWWVPPPPPQLSNFFRTGMTSATPHPPAPPSPAKKNPGFATD